MAIGEYYLCAAANEDDLDGHDLWWRSLDFQGVLFCLLCHVVVVVGFSVCTQYLYMAAGVPPQSCAHSLKIPRDLYEPQRISSPPSLVCRRKQFKAEFLLRALSSAHICEELSCSCLPLRCFVVDESESAWNSVMAKCAWICAGKCGEMALETGVAVCGGGTERNAALGSYSFSPRREMVLCWGHHY